MSCCQQPSLTWRITGPYTEIVNQRTGMVIYRIPSRNMTETAPKLIERIREEGR
jgi:hypothetical protein